MKTCFVIGPFGEEDSKERERFENLLARIIQPVLDDLGYSVVNALRNPFGMISKFIHNHLFSDDLVIADLSDSNANVLYELGLRHAWGGKTVHLSNDVHGLPFNVKDYTVFQYDLSSRARVETLKADLKRVIQDLEAQTQITLPVQIAPETVIRLANATVLVNLATGQKAHYRLAQGLADKDCRRIFLMQRSSSMILGPERNFPEEAAFYHALLTKIHNGVQFYHIVSLEGISRHLERASSFFPETKNALKTLVKYENRVAIPGDPSPWVFKRVPDAQESTDMKPDRQARVFIIEGIDGVVEAALVFDLGGVQSCFHLRGPEISRYLEECVNFYLNCPDLMWDELSDALKKHPYYKDFEI